MQLHEIEGIGPTYANLHAQPATTNDEKQLVRRVPTESEVAGWVERAKALPLVVTH